jgi:excisionase family DNA binding protein
MPDQTPIAPLLSAEQLASSLGMSRRWVYMQVEENGLPAYKLGRSLAFQLDSVQTWLDARRVGQWPTRSCVEPISDDSISCNKHD